MKKKKPTTVKRRSFCLTQEMLRQIDELSERLGEAPTQVMARALQHFYFYKFPRGTKTVTVAEYNKMYPLEEIS